MKTFGAAFGELMRSKREGVFTQLELAIEAYDDETKVRRIVDLETGKIARPQGKTIQPIIDTLNISPEELEACRNNPTLDLEKMDAIGLSRALLENLARRFDFDRPDAQLSELEDFLRDKATEWIDLRARIDELRKTETQLSNVLDEAETLLEVGEFEAADAVLGGAEEIQDQRVLLELDRKSRLRRMRGHAALLGNKLDRALTHFEVSASIYSDFDKKSEFAARNEYVSELRAYGYRYKNLAALRAAGVALICNLKANEGIDEETVCRCKLALAGVRWRIAQFGEEQHRLKHFGRARTLYDDVLSVCEDGGHPEVLPIVLSDSANLLREAHNLDGGLEAQVAKLEAIRRYKLALKSISKDTDQTAWGIIHHNLGITYTELSGTKNDLVDKSSDLETAIEYLEKSFAVRDMHDAFQYWLATCRSISEAIIDLAQISSDRERLLERARTILVDALSQIVEQEHPNQWAELRSQFERL